jgi:hypothetical protein
MNELKQSHKAVQGALEALQESLELFQKHNKNKIKDVKFSEISIDAIVRLFERSIDLTWEHLKLYLEKKEDVEFKVNGAKPTIKCAVSANVLTKEEANKAIEMLDCRIFFSIEETGKEEAAERIRKLLPEYLILMKTIVEKTK